MTPHPVNASSTNRRRTLRSTAVIGAAVVLLTLSACGSGAKTGAKVTSDASATLTVWTDDTRQPAVEAYRAAHPDVKMNIVLTSFTAGQVAQKIALDDKAGTGWPDVVFLGNPSDVSQLAAAPLRFAAPLNDLVPQSVRDGYAKGTVAGCSWGGQAYCLPNDVAPVVLWVNQKLMKQFGYTVPTTMAQYQALGEKVAAQHPGYLVGDINDRDGYGAFLGSSGCTDRQVTDPTHITIDLSADSCTRVTKLLQPLVEDGSVSPTSPWDTTFAAKVGAKDKFLMYPAAAWFGAYGFKGTYKLPNGEIAAYPMPTWPGSTTPVTGAEGGGLWVVSSHSKNTQGAADMITWLTTDSDPKGIVASPTLPAYTAVATRWCAAQKADPFYASDPCPVEQREADLMSPTFSYIRFEGQFDDSYAQTVIAAATSKGDLTAALSAWQGELVQAAGNADYTVSK
ncbi:ABC transporter substrate-binding protein [Streptacidiphilus sp. P02-A3a]|uniref:ABC transporter substrate-binding protein n=1 Tax=Streptacidiphilus sp. P02-A3a TaxID=2704468 RepID=UPI0015FC03F0|nr:ABC transporter substrate-binding protein [Streptacidiphilus sp. P02-A3a]QMU71691.1 carbohydrate ABC transporter substrate-binding protein [Streptacidiphilus sp. P02-A3a]